jgi:hypothetical protein
VKNSEDGIQKTEFRMEEVAGSVGTERQAASWLAICWTRVEAGKTTFTPKAKMNEILRIHGLLS